MCAFAFEASVHEQTAELSKELQFGKLRVLPVRMNPDLAMFGDQTGRELLKKTGAANLFTVFGEPDVRITRTKDQQVVVEVRGVDVFDPTTGEVRSGGTDDIACWLIDTDYDGQSFFVRHLRPAPAAGGPGRPAGRLCEHDFRRWLPPDGRGGPMTDAVS